MSWLLCRDRCADTSGSEPRLFVMCVHISGFVSRGENGTELVLLGLFYSLWFLNADARLSCSGRANQHCL